MLYNRHAFENFTDLNRFPTNYFTKFLSLPRFVLSVKLCAESQKALISSADNTQNSNQLNVSDSDLCLNSINNPLLVLENPA